MTADELVISVRVAAENSEATLSAVKDALESVGVSADGVSVKTKGMGESAGAAAAAQAALAAAAVTAFSKIVGAINTGVEATNRYVSATMGLQSIAQGKGIDGGALSASLENVTDQFFSASDAAAAFKNLLSRGYSLDQATQTIMRLKDAAAFGRQASYSLAGAVVSATEGIKNENSILVDNAGVTKNVAKMWEDYAKSIGVTTQSLTQAQKVEAEFLGIQAETALQVGDLAKAADTLAGSQAEQAAQAEKLAQAYGSAMEPAAKIATETFTGFLETVTELTTEFPELAAGITTAAVALGALAAASSAVATIKKLTGALTLAEAAQKLFNTTAWNSPYVIAAAAVVTGISLVSGALAGKAKAEKEAAEAYEAFDGKVAALKKEQNGIEQLATRYRELTSAQSLTEAESAELEDIVSTLSSTYGINAAALAETNGAYSLGNKAIEDRTKALKGETDAEIALQIARQQRLIDEKKEKYDFLTSDGVNAVLNSSPDDYKIPGLDGGMLADNAAAIYKDNFTALIESIRDFDSEFADELQGLFDMVGTTDADGNILYTMENFVEAFKSRVEKFGAEIADMEEYKKALQDALNGDYSGLDALFAQDGLEGAASGAADAVQSIGDAMKESAQYNKGLEEARDRYKEINDELARMNPEDEGYDAARAEALEAEATGLEERYALEQSLLEIANEKLVARAAELELEIAEAEEGEAKLKKQLELLDVQDQISANQENINASIKDGNKEQEKTNRAFGDAAKLLEGMDRNKAVTSIAKSAKKAGKEFDDLSDAVKAYARANGYAGDSIDGFINHLSAQGASSKAVGKQMIAEMEGIIDEMTLTQTVIGQGASGTVYLDTAEFDGNVEAAKQRYLDFIEAINASFNIKGGGGGGGRKKKDPEEEARKAAEDARRAQEEAYQEQLRQIDHKRKMDQITAQEEIALLEDVKRNYAKTADQIMDIDERIYEARKKQREKEQDQIDKLHDGLMDALEARYEKQREEEQARIDESIAAWEKWSDDTTSAIQAQIDALDEKAKAEDREAQAAEKMRKIDNLEQQMLYETDEYNLRQLQKQLEKAQEDWATLQSKWEREDKKAELQSQIDAVEQEAQTNIDALEAESDRIDAFYDKLTQGASLAAEAQQMLMSSSQQEILSIMAAYAPEYNATGKTLGEKFYDGFVKAMGDVSTWFEGFNTKMEQAQQNAFQNAINASEAAHSSGGGTANVTAPKTINQTVNFNTPVETPADTYNKMQEANEQLAATLG